MDIDDETLMALADGEITGEAARRLQAQIAADADLAARYAVFTETARLAGAAMRADPAAAVSADLAARVAAMATAAPAATGTVVPFRRAKPAWQPMALAASIALAVGLSAGVLLAPGSEPTGALSLTAALEDRLDSTPSGAQATLPDGRAVQVVASFIDAADAFCREFEIETTTAAYVSVACRQDDGWQLRFAMARPADVGGYTPASALEALDAYYASIGAEAPLAPDAERRFLKQD